VLAEYARLKPQMYATIQEIMANPNRTKPLWEKIEKISLDFAIMEHAQDVAVIPVDIGWSDIGTWASLLDVLSRDEQGNAVRSAANDHIRINTKNTLIVGNRMVVTIGVSDLVIVETDDAILVCHRDHAQDVKQVVELLKQQGKTGML
jgi:mannose-1-phosphate guanylyltransferase